LIVLPFLENLLQIIIEPLGFIFILISIILGFYLAYRLVIWVDGKIPNTEFGIWARRGVLLIFVLFGLGLGFLLFLVYQIMATSFKVLVSVSSIIALIICFCFGLAIVAGYIVKFGFERMTV